MDHCFFHMLGHLIFGLVFYVRFPEGRLFLRFHTVAYNGKRWGECSTLADPNDNVVVVELSGPNGQTLG